MDKCAYASLSTSQLKDLTVIQIMTYRRTKAAADLASLLVTKRIGAPKGLLLVEKCLYGAPTLVTTKKGAFC